MSEPMSDNCLIRSKPKTAAFTKEGEGLTIYLLEELSDARLRLAQLKNYIKDGMELIEKSGKRDEMYELAAHLLHGIPDTVFKLEKALNATAMAVARMDYEEIKQTLKPEKAGELEDVLPDVRLRYLERKGTEIMTPKKAAEELFKIASSLKDKPNKTQFKESLRTLLACMDGPPATATEEPVAKFEEGKPADPTENMSDSDRWQKEHVENKDNFKAAADVGVVVTVSPNIAMPVVESVQASAKNWKAERAVVATSDPIATEFATQEGLNNYLKEHPDADPSKHSVRKPKPGDKVVVTDGPHKGKEMTVNHLGPKKNGVPHMNVKPEAGSNGPYGWAENESVSQHHVKHKEASAKNWKK